MPAQYGHHRMAAAERPQCGEHTKNAAVPTPINRMAPVRRFDESRSEPTGHPGFAYAVLAWVGCAMKLVAEYLERHAQFRRMADTEKNLAVKRQMLDQAEAYYRLAVKRARALNHPIPERTLVSPTGS